MPRTCFQAWARCGAPYSDVLGAVQRYGWPGIICNTGGQLTLSRLRTFFQSPPVLHAVLLALHRLSRMRAHACCPVGSRRPLGAKESRGGNYIHESIRAKSSNASKNGLVTLQTSNRRLGLVC